MMKRVLSYISLLILLMTVHIFTYADNSIAQTYGINDAKNISQRAQYLYDHNRCDKAIKVLNEGLSKCSNKNCRAMLNFSLGFLYQQEAEKDGVGRLQHLENAAKLYSVALNDLPDNIQIINNLALVSKSMGMWNRAVDLLKKAVEVDRNQSDLYMTEIGDIYREHDNLKLALSSYIRASEANPDNKTPLWRILTLYQRLPGKELKDLLTFSMKLIDMNHAELARYGFQQVINRSYPSKPELAKKVFLSWVELGSSEGWISKESFQSLPVKSWSFDGLQELHRLVMNPFEADDELHWWTETPYRRDLVANVMNTLAKDILVKGKVKNAVHIYESALKIAPEIYSYDDDKLKNKTIIRMNIALELASLYHKYPNLDPDGKKFKDLERRLFNEKAFHYAKKDLPGVQRSHTVLGLIYVERKKWKSERGADNAIFQLEHALSTAKERTKRNPSSYQPLPYLNKLLAMGYASTGKLEKTYSSCIEAVKGYLDYDDLEKAEQVLKKYSGVSTSSVSDKKKHKELRMIVDTRKQIPKLKEDSLNPTSNVYYEKISDFNWLKSSNNLALDKSFLNRQRFKALADFGERASNLGLAAEPVILKAQALEVIKKEKTLANMDDVVRLKNIKKILLLDKNIFIKNPYEVIRIIDNRDQGSYKKGNVLSVTLPCEQHETQIAVSQDLFIAAEIQGAISKENDPKVKPLKLSIGDSEVTILKNQRPEVDVEKAKNLIQSIMNKEIKVIKSLEPQKNLHNADAVTNLIKSGVDTAEAVTAAVTSGTDASVVVAAAIGAGGDAGVVTDAAICAGAEVSAVVTAAIGAGGDAGAVTSAAICACVDESTDKRDFSLIVTAAIGAGGDAGSVTDAAICAVCACIYASEKSFSMYLGIDHDSSSIVDAAIDAGGDPTAVASAAVNAIDTCCGEPAALGGGVPRTNRPGPSPGPVPTASPSF